MFHHSDGKPYSSDLEFRQLSLLSFRFFIFRKFLIEFLDTACGVDQFLRAREKRMALRADFHANIADSGTRLESIAARACHRGQRISGMNSFFHSDLLKFDVLY